MPISVPLSNGSINDIIRLDKNYPDPVLQILEIQEAKKKSPTSVTRYRIALSDGEYHAPAFLASPLNDKIINKEIQTFSIIKLSKYTVQKTNEVTLFVVLSFQVLDNSLNDQIGNPKNIKSAPPTPVRQPAPPAPLPPKSFSPPVHQNVAPTKVSSRSPLILPISSLNNCISNWVIQVRVINKSEIREFKNNKGRLFTVILQDSQGSQIKGTAFTKECDRIYDQIEQGKLYKVSGGKLQTSNAKYNHTGCDVEITFTDSSQFEALDDDGTISVVYNFITLNDLASLPQTALTADIIAVINEVGPLSTFMSKKQVECTKRSLQLCDSTGKQLELVLWGQTAINFNSDPSSNATEDPLIVALKGVTISHYSGISLSVSGDTLMTLNPTSLPEYTKLKNWYNSKGQYESFQTLSLQKSMNNPKFVDAFLSTINDNFPVDISPELDSSLKNKMIFFNCYGLISEISTGRKLIYMACPNQACRNKGLQMISDGSWTCSSCNSVITEPVPKFAFSFKVCDPSGSTFVGTIGDEGIGQLILGKSAKEWAGEMEGKDEQALREYFSKRMFSHCKFQIKTKGEEYQNKIRPKSTVMNVSPIDFSEATKLYISEIKKYA